MLDDSSLDDRSADFDEAVYDVVERIPAGWVMSYGDIAEYVGVFGPRRVAQAMSRCAGAVPWHRVVRTDGTPAPHLAVEQLARLRAEGAPVSGSRVDMRLGRWDGSA
ncbi:MAG: MGMT family protein [Actinomycetota bacterium]|nr:MGMT family protein [Actinomycetota bacterium]